jgi:hypothetical protein
MARTARDRTDATPTKTLARQAYAASIFCTSLTSSRRCTGLTALWHSSARPIGVERHRGKAGDEHDLDIGVELEARRASSMPSISGITMSVSSARTAFAQPLMATAVVERSRQRSARLHQEAPHVVVIFGKDNLRHLPARWGAELAAPRPLVSASH